MIPDELGAPLTNDDELLAIKEEENVKAKWVVKGGSLIDANKNISHGFVGVNRGLSSQEPRLQVKPEMAVDRVYTGSFVTFLNLAGFSTSIMKADMAVLWQWDASTKAPQMPVSVEWNCVTVEQNCPPAQILVPVSPSCTKTNGKGSAPSQQPEWNELGTPLPTSEEPSFHLGLITLVQGLAAIRSNSCAEAYHHQHEIVVNEAFMFEAVMLKGIPEGGTYFFSYPHPPTLHSDRNPPIMGSLKKQQMAPSRKSYFPRLSTWFQLLRRN